MTPMRIPPLLKRFVQLASVIWIVSMASPFWGAEPERQLLAGTSAIDISPTNFPVELAGNMTVVKATSLHDPLMARCLVLDNGETVLAFVSCDSCMLPKELIDRAKGKARSTTKIPEEHIVCSATHCHSAVCVTPLFQSQPDRAYADMLVERIAEGIERAHRNRQRARIGWGVGNVPQHVFNRRWHMRSGTKLEDPLELGSDRVRMNPTPNDPHLEHPAGPTDPLVPILAVQTLEGESLAVWANYSLHYVGGVPPQSLSADYFGEFAKVLAESVSRPSPAFVAAMTNGTSGDINNINFFDGRKAKQETFEQIRRVARDVADAVNNTYQRIAWHDWVELKAATEILELGVRRPSTSELARAREVLREAGPGPWTNRQWIYANETVGMAEYPSTVPVVLQAVRVGDLGIATTPCETFVETGLAIKEESPFLTTFTIELANGYNGYLPTPEQHALGGYETWRAKSSYLSIDSEPKVRSTLLKLLKTCANGPAN
jgi:neutral ceramidase